MEVIAWVPGSRLQGYHGPGRPKYTMMPRTLEATGGIDIAGTKQKWEVESQLLGET